MGLPLLVDGLKIFSNHLEKFGVGEEVLLISRDGGDIGGFFVEDRPGFPLGGEGSEPL